MNVKVEKFDVLVATLKTLAINGLQRMLLKAMNNTVVYHGRLEIHEILLPVFIKVG